MGRDFIVGELRGIATGIIRVDGDRDPDNTSNLPVEVTVGIAARLREIAEAITTLDKE